MRQLIGVLASVLLVSTPALLGETMVTPLPLPQNLRVQSSAPLAQVWNSLSKKEKQFAYHLIEAGKAGRTLLFYQNHRDGLLIRDAFKLAFNKKNLPQSRRLLGPHFSEVILYSAKFLDQSGPYAASNRKYILAKTPPTLLQAFFKAYLPKQSEKKRKELVTLLLDPTSEVQQYPENPDGEGLEETGGNLYEKGISGESVNQARKKGLDIALNGRVVRKNGNLYCPLQTTSSPGIVGKVLREIVTHLKAAKDNALTEKQKEELEFTIKYLEKGALEDFRQANIAWVKDRASSSVDFILGWVEVYEDWLASIGSWESYVQIVDRKVSETAQSLAQHAQDFEEGMPYEKKYKKKFPEGYSPPAIMVYYFQEVSSLRTGGYNLPNFDDIRRDVGAKNVIRLPLPGEDKDPEIRAMNLEMLKEFAPASKVEILADKKETIWQNIVLLHEIIGHGSGTYNKEKYPNNVIPISQLGALGSALEEQRADLAALAFMGSPILVKVGIYKNAEEAKLIRNLSYDYYLVDFLRRTSGQRSFTEAHQRGHWLFIYRLLDRGAVAWAAKDEKSKPTPENQVLVVKDYDKFEEMTRSLLGELQDIKAEKKEEHMKTLFAKEAPLEEIEKPWAQAVIKRGKDLKINAGYIEQPWRITPQLQFELLGGNTIEAVAPYWNEYY